MYEFPGTPVHDALAVAHVVRGDLLRTEHRNVEIDCASELCRGRTVVDLWQISGRNPNAHVGVEVQGDALPRPAGRAHRLAGLDAGERQLLLGGEVRMPRGRRGCYSANMIRSSPGGR